jgi:lysozyme
MKISQKGLDLIKKFEGFSAKPYVCPAGVPTIGYGATYYTNGTKVTMSDEPISEEWAEQLLSNMVHTYEKAVISLVIPKITQNQFDALVSFAYNVGVTNFRKSTLLRLINKDPNNPEIATQFMKWVRGGGKVINGLIKRRQIESKLYFTS